MKRNLTEVQQRLLVILKKDSRKSLSDAAKELGISRITAKKTLDTLIDEGKIRNFTITIDDDLRDMALVHVRSIDGIPVDHLLEYFKIIDGTFLLVMYYEDLVKFEDFPIIDVKIASLRTIGGNPGRLAHIHCDYCGNEIMNNPIIVDMGGKTYYACCPNCERDLKRRKESLADMA